MFSIKIGPENNISLAGRFDASQVEKANSVFAGIHQSCIVDFKELEYISSAGLGSLLMVQKKLKDDGYELTLINMNDHIRDIFQWAGFDHIFNIK